MPLLRARAARGGTSPPEATHTHTYTYMYTYSQK
jgi:hypothetical protein